MKMIISVMSMLISTSVFAASTPCVHPIYTHYGNEYEVENLLQMASVAQPADALKIYSVIGMLNQSDRNALAQIIQSEQNALATVHGKGKNNAICWTF